MAYPLQSYGEPFIYNGLTLNGNAGAALTLRQMIVALSGGAVPPVPILAFRIVPAATARIIGGYDPRTKTFRPAAQGGGFGVITTAGEQFVMGDPLDCVAFTADGVGATTAVLVLYTSGQVGSQG